MTPARNSFTLAEPLKKVTEAEQKLNEARDELTKEIGHFDGEGAKYEEMVELLPVKCKHHPDKEHPVKRPRMAYIKKRYYDDKKKSWHTSSLSGKEKNANAQQSIFATNKK